MMFLPRFLRNFYPHLKLDLCASDPCDLQSGVRPVGIPRCLKPEMDVCGAGLHALETILRLHAPIPLPADVVAIVIPEMPEYGVLHPHELGELVLPPSPVTHFQL